MVPQELVFDPFFTVRETLRLQSGYFGLKNNDKWIDEVMDNLDLTNKADVNMRALSGGMKRRVLVAQALVHKPPVIVLDEPTAGVDVELRQTLWKFISRLNREGHTVVLTTHYLEEAQAMCQRVAMLKRGKVVALDTMTALLRRISGSQLIVHLNSGALPDDLRHLVVARRARGRRQASYSLRVNEYAEVEADPGAPARSRRRDRRNAAAAGRPGRHLHADHGQGRAYELHLRGFPHPVLQGDAALLEGRHPDRRRADPDRDAVPADLRPRARRPGRRCYPGVDYTAFLIPGLVMMSVLQNAFANSSSSLIQSKITGNLVFILLPPLSHWEIISAYVLASVVRGLAVGAGVFVITAWFAAPVVRRAAVDRRVRAAGRGHPRHAWA